MDKWIELVATVVCTAIASSGLWAFIQSRRNRKDVKTKLLVGVVHLAIVEHGMRYIERGWVTHDEYINLYDRLYIPYKELGGNGTAKRVMEEVAKLPVRLEMVGSDDQNEQ